MANWFTSLRHIQSRDQSEFPQLTNLMGAYFNQDYDIHGETDKEILSEYKRCSYPATVAATVAEIDSFLTMPSEGLLDRYRQETGPWDMMIGQSDAEARGWLIMARQVLTDSSQPTGDLQE